MKPFTYFTKNHEIYGISYKAENRDSAYAIRFTDWDEAQKWLNTEEYDFRTRELRSKSAAKAIAKFID